MEIEILRKRLSSYRSPSGRLMRVPDELLVDVLFAWEQWTGPASGFYAALGADHRKMASLIGRAKKLKREGHFPVSEFKEIKVSEPLPFTTQVQGIEIIWSKGQVIRFSTVEMLIHFLKAVENGVAPPTEAKKAA